jgi:23S rRNA (cytosine1962-C5)-methyltransferase
MTGPAPEPPRVIIKPKRALPFFSRHPWVFGGAILHTEGDVQPGSEVAVYTHDDKFIAWGLFNPHSQIRVRLYSWDEDTRIDREFWSRKLDDAFRVRISMFHEADEETAARLVFSEGDGLSGLIVDQFGEWLLVQVTSLAVAERIETILDLLEEKLNPRGIYLRTERGMNEQEQLELQDGLVRGEAPPAAVQIRDTGIRYEVDVVEGQKTGFYLDQRANRKAFTEYMNPGARVLDAFCYSGGFGLAAAVHGQAESVLAIDTSESALELAKANAELNGVADRFEFRQADVFDELGLLIDGGQSFDVVILDPPKLVRSRRGLDRAMKGYFSLNRRALDLLPDGGLLITCSCSGLVSRLDFEDMLSQVSVRARRNIRILEARGQAADHPVSTWCTETNYLKCYICWVE